MTEELHITLEIKGKPYAVCVPTNDEWAWRESKKIIEQRMEFYKNAFNNPVQLDALMYVALEALSYYLMLQKSNESLKDSVENRTLNIQRLLDEIELSKN
jgi:Cell division protein ZapA